MNGRSLAAVLLAMLCALQLVCLLRAAPAWSPAAIHVLLRAGESVTLGKQELGTPDAALHQLALRRDGQGRWWVRNTNPARMAVLHRGGQAQRMGSHVPVAGSQVAIGAGQFAVVDASDSQVTLRQGSDTWRYDGATLLRNGSLQPACPDAGIAARAGALWNRIAPAVLTSARPLLFGGNLHCGNRLGIAYLPPASASLARVEGRLLLSGRAGGEERAPVLVDGADLALGEQPLAGVQAIGLGRTRLQVAQERSMLTLTPQRHVLLAPAPQAQLPSHVNWTWQQRAAWTLPLPLAALAAAALIGAGILWRWRRASLPVFAAAMLAVAGLAALLLQRAGHAPGVGVSMILGWAALWLCLRAPGRLALATAAGVLLLAVGLLAQLDLGVSAAGSSWLRYYQKTVALLALGLGAGTLVRLAAPRRMLPQTRLEWLLAALACAALAALLMQVLFGDETGVFDLQPVEFAKLALTALTAHCLAIGAGWNRTLAQHERPAVRWLRMAAPVLLFAALLAFALVQVDDFSPLILLLVWSAAMLLAWSLAARHHAVSAAVAVAVCLAAGAIGYLRLGGAEQVAQAGPGFYADRFMVWLDPAAHPHTGQQLLTAARAIGDGAWWGSDQLLGLASLGQPAGAVLRIPAIQDDFAPAFFLNRHGVLGALALWSLQALFLAGLLQTAGRALSRAAAARDFRQAWQWRFRGFALCGGAAFVLGHFLLSWGTNLAIFPVMGQPMSFLSAGGSHLLLFICPLLAFSAMSAQSFEENQDARLRPA